MSSFMGGFFLTFSFFKLLDLRGFCRLVTRCNDIVGAKVARIRLRLSVYRAVAGGGLPNRFQPALTNLITLAVMAVSAVGVLKACLPSVRSAVPAWVRFSTCP